MQKAKTYENEIHNKDRIIFYDNFIIPRLPPPVKECKLLKYMNKIKKISQMRDIQNLVHQS